MNNLKRVLSLVMSGAMLVGMLTVGASAANTTFSDADEITHTEAVNTMAALGVIKGKDTGAYDPKGNVTRAEMAKIVCVMLNGGEDPAWGTDIKTAFSDTQTHWARNYIAYCANKGIIAGQGDGTFNPDGNVTGAQAAKMMLVALNYDPDIFHLTGNKWEDNTNDIASEKGLYKSIKGLNTSVALNRDDAAQMAYNCLEAKPMVKSFESVAADGEITYKYNEGSQKFLSKYFDAETEVGPFLGNADVLNIKDGEIQVEIPTYDKNGDVNGKTTVNLPVELDIGYIGEEVKVIYKDDTSPAGLSNKDTIYGVFPTGDSTVYHTTKADIKDDADAGKVKFDGNTYNVAASGTIMYNYGVSANTTWSTKAAGTAAIQALKDDMGDTVKLVASNGSDIDKVFVVESKLAVVLSKNSSEISLNNGGGAVKIADNEVYEDIAKDDVVVYTRLYNSDPSKGYTIVEKAEKVSGEVQGYKTTESVTMDGTTYKIYDKTTMFKSGLGSDAVDKFNNKIGESFDLYMVNGYVAAAVQTSEGASNWSMVLEAKKGASTGSTFDALQLSVMAADGTKSIITVSKDTKWGKEASSDGSKGDNEAGITTTDFPRGTLITYSVNKDGEAVIKDVVPYAKPSTAATGTGANITWTAPVATVSYDKDTKTLGGTTTTTDCVLFVNTAAAKAIATAADEVTMKAYKIRDLGNVNLGGAKVGIVATKDGKAVAGVIDLQGPVSGATTSRIYGIISAENGTYKVDNDEKSWYTASVNGEDYTIYLTTGSLKKGDIVSFEPANDNIYSNVETGATVDGSGEIHKVGNGDGSVTSLGFAKEYNEADETITLYTALKGLDKNGAQTTTPSAVASYEGDDTTVETYAVNDDTKFYWVDKDGKTSASSGSVVEFDAIKGYNNIIVVKGATSGNDAKFAKAVIVETSRKADLLKKTETTKTLTSLTIAAGDVITATSGGPVSSFDGDKKATQAVTLTGFDAEKDNNSITMTAAASGGEVSMTVNGEKYTSGAKYVLTSATNELVVKVTIAEFGCSSVTYTITLNTSAA